MPKSIEFNLTTPHNPFLTHLIRSNSYSLNSLEAHLLSWIQRGDEQVARKIHESYGMKPYTISPIKISEMGEKDIVKFRVTLLIDDLWDVLNKGVQGVLLHSPNLKIGGTYFLMNEPHVIKQETYEELFYTNISNIILRFESPIIFNTGNTRFSTPDPKLVFSNLQKKWNEFAPLRIDEEWSKWASKSIRISRHEPVVQSAKRTRYPHYGDETTGFIGKFEYVFRPKGRGHTKEENISGWRTANILASYAYYCGVGNETISGFGQTTRLEKWMKTKFFISHSSKDSKTAEQISSILQSQGYDTWLDKKDITIGQSIIDRVSKGIDTESDFVVMLISKNSLESEWCKLELRMAYQKELSLKRTVVLPIKIDNTEVPPEIMIKKYFQFAPRSKKSVISLLQEISSLLQSIGSKQ